MKHIVFLLIFGAISSPMAHAASCSRANLTRCLDSVCAINVSSNPAARCQYCGTSSAGTPPKSAMQGISVGASAKYNISDKELKKAPTDPGERYAWATQQCIKKVAGCSADDVSETYDKMIEQSCKAAGISAQMAELTTAAKKTKSKTSCTNEIQTCLISDTKCGSDYGACESDADFNKFFAACGVDAAGCDDHVSAIRSEMLLARDNAIKNADTLLANIVASYQAARDQQLATARANCTNNAGREKCIETVCQKNMNNKCATGFEGEKAMATQLCKFYDLACAVLD